MIIKIILATVIVFLATCIGYLWGRMDERVKTHMIVSQMGALVKKMTEYVNNKEKVVATKIKAHCPKCGDEILADEDALCGRCI